LLHPLESVLYSVVPKCVLVLAHLSIRVWRYVEAFLIPVDTAAAVLLGTRLVATTDGYTSVQVPVGQASIRGWELLVAVERCSKAWNDAANLVCCPESDMLSASFLQKIRMARVEANSTHIIG
jgi:hypothetical protein